MTEAIRLWNCVSSLHATVTGTQWMKTGQADTRREYRECALHVCTRAINPYTSINLKITAETGARVLA